MAKYATLFSALFALQVSAQSGRPAAIANATYDYIVAGGGVAGIIAAERIAESGASVLLLERGGASTASSGNTDFLPWNNSVTLYDVPGFAYVQKMVGKPAFCTDTADQAACLLGGGSMVNAMMFVPPGDRDFDAKWPAGWKSADIAPAAKRVHDLNPGQTYGSEDGKRYNDEAYDFLSKFFSAQGFSETDPIENPSDKVDVFTHPPWSIVNGLRSGPVRTYLPLAQELPNFNLQLNTQVVRAVRNGSTISGVETVSSSGERIIYNVKAGGRVVLAAGTLSTPRILFNSGIGPAKQLEIVASGNTSVTLPAKADWINLPVGEELKDHPIFTANFKTSTPVPALNMTAFANPDQTSIDLFAKSSGLLSQSGQRFNFWTAVNTTSANSTESSQVFIQGTCAASSNNTIQMKIYLTHGATSVGSLGIKANGTTEITVDPRMNTEHDIQAITTFMDRLLAMSRQPNSTLTFLPKDSSNAANVTGADLVKNYTPGAHYIGTAKMGTKGEAGVVVDSDTKVYGTDNLFIVDASIHPDLPTGNTQAIVMVAAEAAAAKILALGGQGGNQTVVSPPVSTGGYPVLPHA